MTTFETLALDAAGKAAEAVITRASPAIIDRIGKRLKLEGLRVRVQFTKTFEAHLKRSFERSLKIKTVTSKDQPVLLEDMYVPLLLRSGEESALPDIRADPTRMRGARFVISGTGGAGKTVLMKHLLNISKDNSMYAVPLFMELRNLEFDSADKLESVLFKELNIDGGKESFDFFRIALEEGLFVLYLDGFDEIHPDESHKALSLIRRFCAKFPDTSILITTRPKTGIATLREFTVFHVEPLTKESAVSLIEKTEFDEITKNKFIESMKDGLFEKHKTLMSLPILVAMMLLAFRTYADIPDRMTVFYAQAFETLYSIHDAENKELFKRQHHARLAPDVFRNVLQTFCYISLSNHDIEFSESTLDSYIERALKITKVDTTVEKYKNDLIHNVCVIQPDGLSYVFVHRSFQEYFASQFALNYSGEQTFQVITNIVNVSGSAVALMMLEINEIKTKRLWLLPAIQSFRKYLSSVKRRKLINQISAFISIVWIGEDKSRAYSFGVEGNRNFRTLEIISSCISNKLSFFVIMDKLRIPSEARIAKEVPRSKLGAKLRPSDGIVYPNDRIYYFKDGADKFLAEAGFARNLEEIYLRVSQAERELAAEVEEYGRTEENELFS